LRIVFARGEDAPGNRYPLLVRDFFRFIEHDIAEPRRPLAARPVIELIEERARLHRRTWRRNGAHDPTGFDHVLERVEGHVVARKFRANIGDDKRIAQIRLVGAVFQHRLAIGNARKNRRHQLAAAEFFEHAA
jgi:hypothetical protein